MYKQQRRISWLLALTMMLLAFPRPEPVFAQAPAGYPLERCEKGAFSTEEDFVMQEGEPYDGDPYVSDGDVLSVDGQVCARNADLLAIFFSDGRYTPDLGLDALDIIDIPNRLVVFSTELSEPGGLFYAGDLLFTNGAVIPNTALVANFGIDYDIGLDGVQLLGEIGNVKAFVNSIVGYSRERFIEHPGLLGELLTQYKVDIWFSIEQTFGPLDAPIILDGDILAATGVVIAKQEAIHPVSIPAGIPMRGVDFGLDALVTERTPDVKAALAGLRHSSEILFRGRSTFTDGDVLRFGSGVATLHEDLIKLFYPAADFLGLDALAGPQPDPEPDPMITDIGGKSVNDISAAGLYSNGADPQQPFGWFIPIDGYIPSGVAEFRVAFRKASDPVPPPGTGFGINTTWNIRNWNGFSCAYNATYTDDGSGWFTASDYHYHRYTDMICNDNGVVLAVWDTLNDPNVADKNGLYAVWLEWRLVPLGPVLREPVDHFVQLDNELPVINQIELRTTEGVVVQPCGGAGAGTHVFEIFADTHDAYFGGYRIRVAGGNPPADVYYGWHNWWDGTPEVANLDGQGTTPAGLQLLRSIDMNDLGASFTNCCYLLEVWASDVSIRHGFNNIQAYPSSPGWPSKFLTFAAAP